MSRPGEGGARGARLRRLPDAPRGTDRLQVGAVSPERDRGAGRGEPLRAGCVPDLALQRLQSLVGALYAFDPTMELQVARLRSAAQLAYLRAGDLQLGIVHGTRTGANIAVEPIFRGEPLTVILPLGHRLAGRAAVGPEDLRDELLLTFPRRADPGLHDDLLDLVSGAGLQFRAVEDYGDSDPRDVLLAVAEGRGITLAPISMFEIDADLSAVLERVALEPLVRMPDTLLAWRSEPSDAVARVLAAARAAARELHAAS
jgi:LysR substrate binding domain